MFRFLVDSSSYERINRGLIVLQSLYDLVPIALFLVSSIILLRVLYNKMVKGAYVLTAGGIIMVFSAGLLKGIHKFLIGAAQIDYSILDKQFSPTQSIGFFLIFLGLLGMFTKFNKNYTKVRSTAIPIILIVIYNLTSINPYDSSLPFIALMVVGALGMLSMLVYMAARFKDVKAIILFSIAIIAMFGMGYLSSGTTFERAWIQISVNTIYQGSYLLGVILLKKDGLDKEDCFYKE